MKECINAVSETLLDVSQKMICWISSKSRCQLQQLAAMSAEILAEDVHSQLDAAIKSPLSIGVAVDESTYKY